MKQKQDNSSHEDIAIIGVSLKFPQSESLNEFWDNLKAEKSLITEVPAERWSKEEYFGNPRRDGNKTNSIWGGFVENADAFDASFFNISPREAESMDPQQRMALELTWKAMEDAGYKPSKLAGTKTGVFMGVCHWDYAELLERDVEEVDAYMPTGIAYSIIANRVSYFYDLLGPSITNDTACASSLVSIYEAVNAIHNGECDYALAGGVNLIWSPKHFIAFSKSGMLSKDGRCKAFDDDANGYVRGEGGGMLLLKPLSKAVADNDPIYAVIKGIGTNHGGKTSSLTVTNPAAQAELISDIYSRAGVSPETVSYIEAHGPGTPVGDPIEVHGLKTAFKGLFQKAGKDASVASCGLGSVKTNIGHLEGAAGVAGVIKVVASLKNKVLPGTVNFKELNSIISLKDSPFYVVDKTQPWDLKDANGDSKVRRAGVSSFGFGGSNSHILLEEFVPEAKETNDEEENTYAIPLSAKNAERLREGVQNLYNYLVGLNEEELSIKSLAYTQQIGREDLEERVIFLVKDIDTLIIKLKAYLDDETDTKITFKGNVSSGKERISLLGDDDDFDELIDKWLQKGRLEKIAELWSQGASINWEGLYEGEKIDKLRLPTYPFAKEKHWYKTTKQSATTGGMKQLHPLVHANTSTLKAERFTSNFTGKEFFLADHIIKGKAILPGVAYLEMARVAVAAASELEVDSTDIKLKDVVWIRPVVAETDHTEVHVAIYPHKDETLLFEIYSGAGDETVIYCKGKAEVASFSPKEELDITAIKADCNKNTFVASECYELIRKTEQMHGNSMQGVQSLYLSELAALSKIQLPASVSQADNGYVLHPTAMDSIMQTSIILLLGEDQINEGKEKMDAALPFAMESVEVYGRYKKDMWAYVRYADGSQPTDAVKKLNMDLCDDEGRLIVRIKGYSARVFEGNDKGVAASNTNVKIEPLAEEKVDGDLVYTANLWQAKPAIDQPSQGISSQVWLFGLEQAQQDQLQQQLSIPVVSVSVGRSALEKSHLVKTFTQCFAQVQELIKSRPKTKQQLLLLVPEIEGNYAYATLAALLETAILENPKIEGKIIQIAEPIIKNSAQITEIIAAEANTAAQEVQVKYDERLNREVRELTIIDESSLAHTSSAIKAGGVYWLTGGFGGLGQLFTQYLIRQKASAVVLSGRSTLSAEKQAVLEQLSTENTKVIYVQADLSNEASVQNVVSQIVNDYKALNGVFHCAGVVKDAYILTKSLDEIESVFAPKVDGAFFIDEATKDLELDFITLFSSIAAHGNIGQADYAGANAALDAFAAHRNQLTATGQRKGVAIAANWPLWQSGGMQVDAATLQQMKKEKGMLPLPNEEGLVAFEHMIAGYSYGNIGVIFGDRSKIEEVIGTSEEEEVTQDLPAVETPQANTQEVSAKVIKSKTTQFLKEILGKSIRVAPEKIQEDQKLSEYGLDSIVIIDVTGQLEDVFGSLSKTLFFEYVDVQGLVEYFMDEHHDKLIEVLDLKPKPVPEPVKAEVPKVEPVKQATAQANNVINQASRISVKAQSEAPKEDMRPAPMSQPGDEHDIAIVGVGGKYPEADTLEDFWDLLSLGKDCFRKVPSERWEHDEIYFNERDVLGKSTIRTGAFIDDIDKFDPRYFSISQLQAELMSPEVRLFLEVGVKALEDAGYSKEFLQKKYNGDVGVLVGTMSNHYYLYGVQNMLTRGSLSNGSYTGTIPNMLSYYYGFTGPSIFVDTMCSGSSTCIHQAVQMLRTKECKMVVAGGISLLLHPYHFISSSQEHYTSKTADIIRSYGLGADGTILGEGVGAVVLKTLADAKKDGDHIYGVIKGTALSNAGIRNGFTVPNPHNQALAVEKAIADAQIDPRTISYVEGHGSGTALGDPIEIKGISTAFKKHTEDLQFCPIGSVKSNIAHLLGAAGIAGLTKVLLQFKHKKLVPSLHADEINPNINFSKTPFYVHKQLTDWQQPTLNIDGELKTFPRRAGITSIGAGGMNSHIIVEEFDPSLQNTYQAPAGEPHLMVFSAMNSKALESYLHSFRTYADTLTDADLTSVAYTLQLGKNELPCRLAIQVTSIQQLKSQIDVVLKAIQNPEVLTNDQSIVFVASLLERTSGFDADDVGAFIQQKNYFQLGKYWANGVKIDWEELYGNLQPQRASLPAYPFERIRCWYELYEDAPRVQNPLAARTKAHPFIGQNISDIDGIKYTTELKLDEVLDYVYTANNQQQLLPTVFIDTAFAAGHLSGIKESFAVKEVSWGQPLNWSEVSELKIFMQPQGQGLKCYMQALVGAEFINWAEATIEREPFTSVESIQLAQLKSTAIQKLSQENFYKVLEEGGMSYMPYLEGVKALDVLPNQSILIEVGKPVYTQDHFKKQITLSSEVLGALLQGVQYWAKQNQVIGWNQLVPQAINEVKVANKQIEIAYMHFTLQQAGGQVYGNVTLADKDGNVVASITGLTFALSGSIAPKSRPEITTNYRPEEVKVTQPVATSSVTGLREQLVQTLKVKVSGILKFSVSEIDEHTHFYSYGFESIALAKLSENINKEIGTAITPALFFQCENIKELADYLLANNKSQCEAYFANSNTVVAQATQEVAAPVSQQHTTGSGSLEQRLEYALRKYVSQIVKFEMNEIDIHTHFYAYGFESIALGKLAQQINKDLDTALTPAIFFQCENIKELADYMLLNFKRQLENKLTGTPEYQAAAPQATENTADQTIHKVEHQSITQPVIQQQPAQDSDKRVAIVGVAGKFPQSDNLDAFWQHLQAGDDLISDFPLHRYDAFYQQKVNEAEFPKRAGVINDVDKFDADFFSISPVEAELMDPQQRLTLETAWKAIEDAGYTAATLPENTGVFFGVTGKDYNHLLNAYQVPVDAFTATGNAHSMLANRLSFTLDVHGPSEPIDTACSSSLVAIHRAVENINNGTCEMAIAGGVNLVLSTEDFVGPNLGGMLSPDGRCKTFSSSANGYVRGEGVGTMILKPLAKAEADGDNILGVIIGSAINHGGRASSLTAPNAKSQASLIEKAMKGIDPSTISYIEAHGTGTSLGDPVEINGLKLAFEKLSAAYPHNPNNGQQCALGSVKTNIGHLEAAAGIAGVIKVLKAMEHGVIPASLHSAEINPYIDLKGSPFYIAQHLMPWKKAVNAVGQPVPRRAGISSFGFGGANAHLVIEEYDKQKSATLSGPQLIVLSAKRAEALKSIAENLLNHLSERPTAALDSLAYTLQVGREAMEERLAFVASSLDDLRYKLQAYISGSDYGAQLFKGTVRKSTVSSHLQNSTEIETAFRQKDWSYVAEEWAKGAPVNWKLLYGNRALQKMSLPTYPFSKDRYWLPVGQLESPQVNTVHTEEEIASEAFDESFYNQLIHGLSDDSLSIDDALELAQYAENGHSKMNGSH